MRIGTPQHSGVQHVRELDVAGIGSPPAYAFPRVDSGLCLSHGVQPRKIAAGSPHRSPRHHRRHIAVVVRAPTNIAHHPFAYVLLCRILVCVEEGLRGHQLTRCTKTALWTVTGDKRFLQRIQLVAVRQSFNRGHPATVRPDGELTTRVDRYSVQVDRARPTLSAVASHLCTGKVQVVAEHLDQSPSVFDLQRASRPVHSEGDRRARGAAVRSGWLASGHGAFLRHRDRRRGGHT